MLEVLRDLLVNAGGGLITAGVIWAIVKLRRR